MTKKNIPEWYLRFYKAMLKQRKAIESSLEKSRIRGVSTTKTVLSVPEFVKLTQDVSGSIVGTISNFASAASQMSTTACEGAEEHIIDARLKVFEDSVKEMLRSRDRVTSTTTEQDATTLKDAFTRLVTAPLLQICDFVKTLPDPSLTEEFPSETHMRIEFDFDEEAAAVKEELNRITQRQEESSAPANGACFVATAIYGDSNAWQVEVFRQFRDNRLLSTNWGRLIVRIYERTGPRLAAAVRPNSTLGHALRRLLDVIANWMRN